MTDLDSTPRWSWWRWQITLGGLFVFTTSIVLGLVVWKVEQGDTTSLEDLEWFLPVMAMISTWVVWGLTAQAYDLWHGYRGRQGLTREERWGWRLACGWRVAVAGLLVGYFIVHALNALNILPGLESDKLLASPTDSWSDIPFDDFLDVVLMLSLIIAFTDFYRPSKRHPLWRWCLNIVGGIGVALMVMLVFMNQMLLTYLVHLVIAHIEMAIRWVHQDDPQRYSPERSWRFLYVTSAGGFSLLMSGGLWYWFSSIPRPQGWKQTLGIASLLVSVLATVAITVWIAEVEIPRFSPLLAQNIMLPARATLVALGILVLMVTIGSALRGQESESTAAIPPQPFYPRHRHWYYHQQLLPALFLLTIILANAVDVFIRKNSISDDLCDYLVYRFLYSPLGIISFALMLLLVLRVFTRRPKLDVTACHAAPRLSLRRFSVVGGSFAVILLCSSVILSTWILAVMLAPQGS